MSGNAGHVGLRISSSGRSRFTKRSSARASPEQRQLGLPPPPLLCYRSPSAVQRVLVWWREHAQLGREGSMLKEGAKVGRQVRGVRVEIEVLAREAAGGAGKGLIVSLPGGLRIQLVDDEADGGPWPAGRESKASRQLVGRAGASRWLWRKGAQSEGQAICDPLLWVDVSSDADVHARGGSQVGAGDWWQEVAGMTLLGSGDGRGAGGRFLLMGYERDSPAVRWENRVSAHEIVCCIGVCCSARRMELLSRRLAGTRQLICPLTAFQTPPRGYPRGAHLPQKAEYNALRFLVAAGRAASPGESNADDTGGTSPQADVARAHGGVRKVVFWESERLNFFVYAEPGVLESLVQRAAGAWRRSRSTGLALSR